MMLLSVECHHIVNEKKCHFSTHFIRTTFPISQEALSLEQEVAVTERGAQSRAQSGAQSISILRVLLQIPLSTAELAEALELESKTGAFKRTIKELLAKELIAYTRPDKPKSRLQKYHLTIKGRALLNNPNQWK